MIIRKIIYRYILLFNSGWTAFILFVGCTTEQNKQISLNQNVTQYSIEDFLGNVEFHGASISYDNEAVLVSSDETGIYNAYAIPMKGGERRQLTHSIDDSVAVISYFPEDNRFLYFSDKGGNELIHIYVRELDGSVVDLTPGENLRAVFYSWAQDDRSFFMGTNERDQRFFDIYEISVEDYRRKMIFQNDDGYHPRLFSPDNRYIALLKIATEDDSDIYLYDRTNSIITLLTPHEGDSNYIPQFFSKDGNSLYITTDKDSEFRYLQRHDLLTGSREIIEQDVWDIRQAYISKHGKYLVVSINRDARIEMRFYQSSTMERVLIPQLPNGVISYVNISRDENHMVFYVSTGRNPKDLFHYDFSTNKLQQLTRSLNPKIKSQDLVNGEVIRFTSFDGLEIPGILYKPHQASEDNKAPALVSVHGGPGGQSRVGYNALHQYLVNHGYVVYAINNRGSSGYGKTFQQLDDQKHGEGDLDDCVSSKRMLIETGYVNPDQIGIIGVSYGGYMVLAALAFRSDEFDVGVDISGISNWYRTVQNIPKWWEAQRNALEKEMGDFDDVEYFRSISPLFHAESIIKPLIVLQGVNDPAVLKIESDEIVEAVEKNGVPVRYVLFEDEGHGIRKKENRVEGYTAILEFLDQYLKVKK